MTSPYGFTALTTLDRKLATKKFTRDKLTGEITSAGYGKAYEFSLREVTFDGIEDLYKKLLVLEKDNRTFIVRGAPLPGVDLEKSRRLLYPVVDEDGNVTDAATFRTCDRAWAMLDVDLARDLGAAHDRDEDIRLVLGKMPDEVADTDMVISWGSSYGITDKLSVHIYVILDRPYSDKELARWAMSINEKSGVRGKLVDDTVFRAVQPHYTAAPVFSPGLGDPLPTGRTTLVRGGQFRRCAPVIPGEPAHVEWSGGGGIVVGGDFGSKMAQIGTAAGFYRPIMSAIASYVAVHLEDTAPLVPMLQRAIREADPGGRSEKEIAGYASTSYLLSKVKWAERQETQRRAALAAANNNGEPQDNQESIRIVDGELPRAADEAEKALRGSGIYQRGSMLVRLIHETRTTVPGICDGARALLIHGVDAVTLVDQLTRRARFEKYKKSKDGWAPCDAPVAVALTVLSRAGQWSHDNLPPLLGILGAPTIRPDGSILADPGYDPATQLYMDADGYKFHAVPENPTKEDAARALELLLEVISEFPFEDRTDRAAAVAAMMTGVIRKSVYSAPLFIFSAPKPRSGKSMLAALVGILATGHRPATMTYKDDPDEESKRYMSLLMAGEAVINIDNISADLGGDALCTILTEPTWTDRMLGRNDASARLTVSTCATFTATGNNLVVRADLAARTLPCRIDPKVEHPEQRAFLMDPLTEVSARRGELVAAILTIIRAYQAAGSPPQGCPIWGGFEAWCRWVRDPLVWLGMADAAAGRRHVEDADPIHQDLVYLLNSWRAMFGSQPRSVAAALKSLVNPVNELASRASDLREAMIQIAGTPQGDINTRRIGKFISSHANRIEGGMCFRKNGLSQKVVLWSALSEAEMQSWKPSE